MLAIQVKRENYNYKVKYIGESWRSGYERGREHQEDLKHLREKSHLLKHILEVHPEKKVNEVKIRMSVKMKFKFALERQVSEAVCIDQAQRNKNILMNS